MLLARGEADEAQDGEPFEMIKRTINSTFEPWNVMVHGDALNKFSNKKSIVLRF
jgi:hypothetical protein